MNNNYQPGDEIEWRSSDGKWLSLGRYVGTTGDGSVVCEDDKGSPQWVSGHETRRVPDMITVTVEISREAAAKIVKDGWGAPARVIAPFFNAVREAVES